MGWLWQLGARWLGSRVWNQATQAATGEVARVMAGQPTGDHQVSMAVLCETKLLFDAVADRLSSRKQFQANRLLIEQGSLQGTAVVVVRPLDPSVEPPALVTAVVDGHAPRFVLSLAEGASLDTQLAPGTLVLATQVIDPAGKSVRLEVTPPSDDGFVAGPVIDAAAATDDRLTAARQLPLAEDRWSAALTRACQRDELPVVVVSAIVEPPREARSVEVAALNKKRSLARRAGVLTGLLMKKPSGFKQIWNDKQARWQAAARIAQLAEALAASSKATPESQE